LMVQKHNVPSVIDHTGHKMSYLVLWTNYKCVVPVPCSVTQWDSVYFSPIRSVVHLVSFLHLHDDISHPIILSWSLPAHFPHHVLLVVAK
jgi:hypothetical protein